MGWNVEATRLTAQVSRPCQVTFQSDTIAGACFRFDSFSSIGQAGTVVAGVDCIAYSDDNCQNK
jgi:hypothetical protein